MWCYKSGCFNVKIVILGLILVRIYFLSFWFVFLFFEVDIAEVEGVV